MTRISQFNQNQTGYLQTKSNKQENINFKAKYYIDKSQAHKVWDKLNKNLKFDFIGLIQKKGAKRHGKYGFEPYLTKEEKGLKNKDTLLNKANAFIEDTLKKLNINFEKVD